MDSAFIINCLETNNLDLIDADPVTMCRTCANPEKDDFRNVFESTAVLKNEESGNIYKIHEIIQLLTHSHVLPDDGLPQRICRPCIKQLYTAYNFLSQAMKIERAYKIYLGNTLMDVKVLDETSHDEEEEVYTDGGDEEDNPVPVEVVSPPAEPSTQVLVINEIPPPPKREVAKSSYCESSPSPKVQRVVTASPKKPTFRSVPTKSLTKVKNANARDFECRICQKKYSFLQSLNRHMHGSHGSKESRKKCSYCSKTFSRTDDLVRHIRTHTNERPYACNVCQKTFKQSSELKEHMQSHTKATIFKCTHCTRKFTSRMGLYNHSKSHVNGAKTTGPLERNGAREKSR